MLDNLSILDVCTVTGTVTDSLSGNPIAGAQVSIASGTSSFSATTNSAGAYSVDVLTSTAYTETVSASGHNTVTLPGNPLAAATTLTTNVQLVLAPGQTWGVTDTFIRPNSSSLGTTQDANAVPWLNVSGTSAISGDMALLINGGGGLIPGAVVLDRTLPANVDMSIDMTWLNTTNAAWSEINYRNISAAVQGYYVYFPAAGTTVQLWFRATCWQQAHCRPRLTL